MNSINLSDGYQLPNLPGKQLPRISQGSDSHGVLKKDNAEKAKLRDVCKDFEAIFLKQMLDAMRKTNEKPGLINGGMAEDIFEDMLYDEYSKVMAKTGSFGLSDLLFKQLETQTVDATISARTSKI
jgi:peptidoglycan hydrolase FlgJ